MLAYVKVFLGNRRYADFSRFLWKYRSEGLAVLRKILFGRMPTPESFKEERLCGNERLGVQPVADFARRREQRAVTVADESTLLVAE